MLPYCICHFYGTWRSKDAGRGFKFIIWWGPSHKVGTILYEWIEVDPSRLFTFSEEYVTPMTVAKDVADHPKNPSSIVDKDSFDGLQINQY